MCGHLPETAFQRLVRGGGALDVVLHAAEFVLTVVVPQRVRGARVTVERHADAARIDQGRAVRPRAAELQMRMTEDDSLVADAVEHPHVALVVGLGGEAVDIRERRAMHVQNAVQLVPRLQRVQPTLFGAVAGLALLQRLHDLRPVERRLARPAFAVAADPRRPRQLSQQRNALERMRSPRPVVAA